MSLNIKCPTCKKNIQWADNPARPFCSERCRTLDLGAWASGDYRVPCRDITSLEETED